MEFIRENIHLPGCSEDAYTFIVFVVLDPFCRDCIGHEVQAVILNCLLADLGEKPSVLFE